MQSKFRDLDRKKDDQILEIRKFNLPGFLNDF
jgi:hypothetical protein